MPTSPPAADKIFAEALLRAAGEERAAYLKEACGEHAQLLERVERLLRAHNDALSFLETPPSAIVREAIPTFDQAPLEKPGTQIGPYKLLEQIGEGGFGVVFMAEQTEPVRRKVALKVLKPGMDTRQVIARFEAERQALAIMDHPNIAKVFDGGATAFGRPYFVMELVKGVPITEFCDQNQLTPRQRLELFIPVCQAVQHAHQKGIVHRDLKPSNVLVMMHDTVPVVKVIDFGVAKALGQELTDKTLFTGFAQMIGSPLYMSPEQAGQSGLDIDTRSDIYALGVLLYELLTGTTPFTKEHFQTAAYDEIRRIIREEEPPKPSTRLSQSSAALPAISTRRQTEPEKLTKILRGELDWIVMKAIEKDRNRRYETANGLALDVQRYLTDEPLEACPPSAIYRMRKFVRRNKRVVLALSAIFLLLIAGITGTTWGLVRAEYSRQEETRQRHLAEAAVLAERKAKEAEAEQLSRAEKALEKAAGEAAISKAVNDFLNNDLLQISTPLGQANRGATPDANLTLRTVLQRAARRIDQRFAEQPEVEMRLRRTIGFALLSTGDYRGALAQYEKVVPYYQKTLGPDDPLALDSMYRMGRAYSQLGQHDKAVSLCEQAFERCKARLGLQHAITMRSLNGLAVVYILAGQKDKGLELAQQGLDLRKSTLGPTHADTLVSMNNLAWAWQENGKLDKAVPLFEEALNAMREKLGPAHPETLNTTRSLAIAYYATERVDQAVPVMETALRQYRATFGADHTLTQSTLGLLTWYCLELGQCDQAEALLTTNLASSDRTPEMQRQIDSRARRIRAVITRVKPTADKFQQEQAAKGADHPDTLAARQAFAVALRQQKRNTGAAYHAQAVLAARERLLGADLPDTLASRLELGMTRLQQKKYAETEPLLFAVYVGMQQHENNSTVEAKSRMSETLQRLVQLYDGWEKKDKADEWRKKLEEQRAGNNIQGTPVFADP